MAPEARPDWIAPDIRVAGRRVNAFKAWGLAGFVFAVAAGAAISSCRHEPLKLLAAVTVASAAAFFAVAAVTAALAGRSRLIFYHHAAAVLLVASGLAAADGRLVRMWLDAAAVGLGTFLMFGRVGCLLAGCCHGRPSGRRWGVVYGAQHAGTVSEAWLGLRLVPVQAMEAAAVAVITAGALGLGLAGRSPGLPFAVEVAAYAAWRSVAEVLRGDGVRPARAGVSAAQWWSLAVVGAVAAAQIAGTLPGPLAVGACVSDRRRSGGGARGCRA